MPKKLNKKPGKKPGKNLAKMPPEKLGPATSEFFNPPKPDPFPELKEQMVVFQYVRGKDFTCQCDTLVSKLKGWGRTNGVAVTAREVVIKIGDAEYEAVHASSRPLSDKEIAAKKREEDKARHKDTAALTVAG